MRDIPRIRRRKNRRKHTRKKHDQQGRRLCDAEDEAKEHEATKRGAFAVAETAGSDSRRDAERGAMRYVADARRAGEADALPAREYFGAVAAHAQAAVRGVRSGEALPNHKQGHACGGLWRGVGGL